MKRTAWIAAACFAVSATFMGASALRAAEPDKPSSTTAAKTPPEAAANTRDALIFRDGKVIYGKITGETASTVKLKGDVKGIAFEAEYQKSEILEIKRGLPAEADAKAAGADPKEPERKPDAAADPDAKRVYVMELTGKFGRDISQTPIRESLEDARKQRADVVVIILQNDWDLVKGMAEKTDDQAAFDELFRAEDMAPVITKGIPEKWQTQPKVVFWVKKAMGGAAFLPLICKDIYFHPDGKMGGIGNLTKLFGQTGDEVVRQKQYSLRMGHAEGLANTGGYDYRIVRAMATPEYVLSVSYEGGRPVYHERLPQGPDETLLTDDAKDTNQDTDREIVAGEGNDVLTLNAKLARDLQISKGTVETLDDLLFELGLSRNTVVVNKGKEGYFTKQWSEGVKNALRNLRKLREQVNEVQMGGDYPQRTKARGQRKKLLNDMKAIIRRYAEIFGEEQALQLISQIDTEINVLDQDQQKDANDNRRK
ncbi:MAG: hypothetical protein IT436_06050 [Phycisphaerales bacterium]|nr:hypothetical protein [Phycisphaerales bacterium]